MEASGRFPSWSHTGKSFSSVRVNTFLWKGEQRAKVRRGLLLVVSVVGWDIFWICCVWGTDVQLLRRKLLQPEDHQHTLTLKKQSSKKQPLALVDENNNDKLCIQATAPRVSPCLRVGSGSIIKYGRQPKKKKIPSKCASKIDLLVVGQLKALWKVKVQGLTWRRLTAARAQPDFSWLLLFCFVFSFAAPKPSACSTLIPLSCERNRQRSPRLPPIYAPLTSPSASRCHLQTG